MNKILSISSVFFALILLISCKSIERSSDTSASSLRDSVRALLIDSSITRFFVDSNIYRVTLRDTVVECLRVIRAGTSSVHTIRDTVTVHQRDTVTVHQSAKPAKPAWSAWQNILFGIVVIIVGLFLSQVIRTVKGSHWYGYD